MKRVDTVKTTKCIKSVNVNDHFERHGTSGYTVQKITWLLEPVIIESSAGSGSTGQSTPQEPTVTKH